VESTASRGRHALFAVAILASCIAPAAGCGGGHPAVPDAGPPPPTRDVDILFMIDNSSDAQDAQQALLRNFPRLTSVLEALPEGEPNLHIAVVSSDMGAGVGINACVGEGDGGVFRYTAHSSPPGSVPVFTCTDTTLQDGATYIASDNGIANYTAPVATVFQCIANLSFTGCGFESPLGSVARALGADGRAPPAENLGFLRPDALLVIVILSPEDDCSTKDGHTSPFYDIDRNTLSGPLGPVQSFRCNEFGHVCDQGAPNRNAPTKMTTDVVEYTNCRSNENSLFLRSVGSFAEAIRRLKSHPDERILVASIVGVPEGDPNGTIPYLVRWVPAPVVDNGPWPYVGPGCGANSTGILFGSPAVRLAEFTRLFGTNGLLYSVCENDYGPTMEDIGERIAERLGR
jgi:hypothetical protein